MKREFLKELGIEDKTVIDAIMNENGKDINDEKAKHADYEAIKIQLENANKKIEEFGKMDFDGAKAEAEKWKHEYQTAKETSENQLKELRFSHTLESELHKAKSKNVKATMALIDRSGLTMNDNGEIIGLKEQIEKMKKDDGYLFENEDVSEPKPSFLGSVSSSNETKTDTIRQIMGLSTTRKE